MLNLVTAQIQHLKLTEIGWILCDYSSYIAIGPIYGIRGGSTKKSGAEKNEAEKNGAEKNQSK